ncbi:MAG: glucose-6-P dehydrogenase subunit-like protein, partial [Verrucomicrobiaceae bacterium]|nr:glucose-6-P dehydrogenase subunit-like protein [Verrucomicrobiaceae bacterium]
SIRNFVFAHLDSDLPLTVWWQGELTERLDERFYSVIDSLIIDSSQWSDPGGSLQKVLSARGSRTSRFTLSDLSWMRSRVMRLALAASCNDAMVLAELPKINRVKITHGTGHRMSALMMAAWLGTQLKCRLAEGQGLRFERDAGAAIDVILEESAHSCPVQSLELSGPDVAISICRDPESCFIRSKMNHPHHCRDEVQPAGTTDDGDLIADQMGRLGGTTLYFEMLPLLQAMLK